ncbi:hypothetical protein [Sphingomicrobium marinum]|uniref:hypothetical protein n=1 Tax=Sphingomicrobium marinum TaxID=1227950 RepID=UPI002240AD89|nr:hypothetical protein [Sphingomicrobium marinum]
MDRYKIVPTVAFLAVLALGAGARIVIGRIYGESDAVDLLVSLVDSGLYIGSATLGGSATILALILTLTSLVRRDDTELSHNVYADVHKVARNATMALFSSIFLLLALTAPTTEMNELPSDWYPRLYNILYALIVVTLATIGATISRLYLTIACVLAAYRDA